MQILCRPLLKIIETSYCPNAASFDMDGYSDGRLCSIENHHNTSCNSWEHPQECKHNNPLNVTTYFIHQIILIISPQAPNQIHPPPNILKII